MNGPLPGRPHRGPVVAGLAFALLAIPAIGPAPLPATAATATTVTTAEEDTGEAEEPSDGQDIPDEEGDQAPDDDVEEVLDEPAPTESEQPAPPQDDGGPEAETVVTMVAIVLMALLILAHALYRDPSRRGR